MHIRYGDLYGILHQPLWFVDFAGLLGCMCLGRHCEEYAEQAIQFSSERERQRHGFFSARAVASGNRSERQHHVFSALRFIGLELII